MANNKSEIMQLHIYKVEKIEGFINTAISIDHDYTGDFEEYRKARGYVKIDYYITDTPDLEINHVYCAGKNLIKPIEYVLSFENEPITLKFFNERKK